MNLIDLLNQNTDQTIPVTVSRTVIGGDTIVVTVYMTVHLICIQDGLATTGYSFGGGGGGTFDYPTEPDDVSLDPSDNNYELNEIT